jgi:HEPN domain-containing protein
LIEKDCSKIDEDFNELIEAAEKLTAYAVEFRYPPNLTVPSVEDVKEAIKEAERIFEFVKDKIE